MFKQTQILKQCFELPSVLSVCQFVGGKIFFYNSCQEAKSCKSAVASFEKSRDSLKSAVDYLLESEEIIQLASFGSENVGRVEIRI